MDLHRWGIKLQKLALSLSRGIVIRIEFKLSGSFKNVTVDADLLRKRIIDLAYNNPGLTFL